MTWAPVSIGVKFFVASYQDKTTITPIIDTTVKQLKASHIIWT